MLYAFGAAVVWGAVCGLMHAPFWAVAIGGLAAAALAIWLEWDALAAFAFLETRGEFFGDLINAEKIVDVGDGNRGHGEFARQIGQLTRPDRAIQQRIGAFYP